jgi:hypothetical protein
MNLLPGFREMRIGDEVVGDGVVLQEDNYEADFTSDSANEDEGFDGSFAADFTDYEE